MINTAIKRAIEQGGYNAIINLADLSQVDQYDRDKILLDPQFWQCLGVAMGWPKYVVKGSAGVTKEEILRVVNKTLAANKRRLDNKTIESILRLDDQESYKFYWHFFIDALASGKTADEAMGEIIK